MALKVNCIHKMLEAINYINAVELAEIAILKSHLMGYYLKHESETNAPHMTVNKSKCKIQDKSINSKMNWIPA